MQPSTLNKPVMDVAAPKSSAPVSSTQPQAVTPVPHQSSELPVRPAPFSSPASQTPAAMPMPSSSHRPVAKKPSSSTKAAPHAPVALITVTVFVMIVLSALAVTVYMTSQTA